MPAVESILVNTTTPNPDTPRAGPRVPFAPFLVSEMEARMSDLAAPRESAPPPVSSDDFQRRQRDDDIHRDTNRDQPRVDNRVEPHNHDRSTPDRTRLADDTRARDDRALERPSNSPSSTTIGDNDTVEDPVKTERVESTPDKSRVSDNRSATVENDGKGTSSTETADIAPTADTTTSSPDNLAKAMQPSPEGTALEVTLAEGPAALPNPQSNLLAAAVAGTTATTTPSPPSGAAPSVANTTGVIPTPALAVGSSGGAGAPPLVDSASSAERAGKIQLSGLAASNDDTPSKVGRDVPQVVRDVQSIISRPANATGGNLVQAHQQGEVTTRPATNTPAPATNAAPLSQNAGQGTPLHVGADSGQGASQGGSQGAGQNNANTNSQQPGGQNGGNTAAGAANGQIAGAPVDTTQQPGRAFQEALARGVGQSGARSPIQPLGEGASAGKIDAQPTAASGPSGTLSADPTSRAAQASASSRPLPSAATEQVSVRLSKAVETGESKLRIQLRPHDLGRVEVKLDIGGDGRAKAMILAERPETLELLQRDSRTLERALQDAGLKTDPGSLSFDLQGRNGEDRAQQAQKGTENDGAAAGESDADPDLETTEHAIPATAIGLAPDGSINFLA